MKKQNKTNLRRLLGALTALLVVSAVRSPFSTR